MAVESAARAWIHRRGYTVTAVVDQAFFILGGVAAVLLAWVVFDDGVRAGWAGIWLYVLLWALVAYLVLPRLHRILTQIYVPNYFIGRARTSDGLLGDPVNLSVRGTAAQLTTAMSAAGWTRADDVTLRSSWRIITSTLTRRSYHTAPVSPLFVFGRMQDLAYQQEVDGNPAKRHHVRFWQAPDGWLLPGGFNVDWVAAGTFDRSVGLSLFTLQVTHKISPDTDRERDHIVATLRDADPRITVDTIRDFATGYHSRNGGGDSIITDGDLPVVDLRTVTPTIGTDVVPSPATELAPPTTPVDPRMRRPLTTVFGAGVVLIGAVSTLVQAVQIGSGVLNLNDATINDDPISAADLPAATAVIVVLLIALALINTVFAALVYRGGNRSRVLSMSSALLTSASAFIAVAQGGAAISLQSNLITVSLNVLTLLALSSRASRDFARARIRLASETPGKRASDTL
ncbi:LssY C-terminal domain-containing protein [Microbacteriaceae bacterium VKM Ac-2855]|nr:LssY C-terminal domain-containing protein [Microbacteriaceae bacterium VKM Ac-2855]